MALKSLRSMVNDVIQRPGNDLSARVDNEIIQQWEYLSSLEDFPFTFAISSLAWTSGAYRRNLSATGIGIPYALFIVTADNEGYIDIIDNRMFTNWFYDLSARLAGKPEYATIRQNYLYLDRKTDQSYTMQYWFHKVDQSFADISAIVAVSAAVSKFPRIVKSILANWTAAALLSSQLGQIEKGKVMEEMGNRFYAALKRRYQRILQIDQAFISPVMARRGWNYRQRINKPITVWGDV